MKKDIIGIVLIALLAAMLLGSSQFAYADEPATGESSLTLYICVTGTTQVQVIASDGSRIDVGTQGTADARMDFTAAADTVMDIYITGEGEADIDVSGPCEVNVRVEGPSQVHIDAGAEVKLNVEASDESQVFVDSGKLDESLKLDDSLSVTHQESGDVDAQSLDNPTQSPDEPAGYQESVVPIISGVFPAAGLLAFFLMRRRAKNNINKGDNQLAKLQERR